MRPFCALVLVLLFSCKSREQGTHHSKPTPVSEHESLEIRALVYHDNDTSSSLFVEIENENLLYKRPDTSTVFYAHLRVSYRLSLDGNPRKEMDTASAELFDKAGAENVSLKSLSARFRVKASFGNNYLLTMQVLDINRRAQYTRELAVIRSSRYSQQNFLVRRNDSVAFGNTFLRNQPVTVQYADSTLQSLSVECFIREFGPALPPFSTKDADALKVRPDSMFTAPIRDRRFYVTTPPSGFYHLKIDASQPNGLTLYGFNESFPGVSSSEEMVDCARYIMSKEEFDKCKTAPDRKKAIDDFWVALGGSNERARELLKRYYARVKEANRNFTSYTQGWKTDRGMISVVFGKPVNVYKSKKDEIWVYGNEANPATLRFVFNKVDNPYSDNDYVMERSQFYKEPWYSAVDYWRQGHVYLEGRR